MTKKILTTVFILFLFFVAGSLRSSAQQQAPELFITWKTETYAPPNFTGKVLPTAGSPITASFEVIDQGVPANLSRQTVYWYINSNFFKGGEGVQSVRFGAPAGGGEIDLRVQLPNYKNNLLVKTVTIPVVEPEAVIESPFPGGKISSPSIRLKGVPYFFNTKTPADLAFSWQVNGQVPKGTENPDSLNVNLGPTTPQGFALGIGLLIQNPARAIEQASRALNLIFSK